MAKVCNILSTLILAVLLILALLFIVPMVLGYTELAVLSGSMEPNIHVGSIVYVDKSVQGEELEVGDVVTYSLQSGTYVTHRVISTDDDAGTLVTQGDANDAPDGEIAYSNILGRVKFHLPYLGYISTNIRTSKGIMAITGLVVIIILLNFLPALLSPASKDGKKKLDAGSEETPGDNTHERK